MHASEVYSEIKFVENRQHHADLLLCEVLYDIANEPIHSSSQLYYRTSLSRRMEIQLKYSG